MNLASMMGIALVTVIGVVILRRYNPIYGLILALVGGGIVFLSSLAMLEQILELLREISRRAGGQGDWLTLLFKAIGIGYICRFASDMCCDVGETAIAGYIELAGKIMIVSLAMPMLIQITKTVMQLMEV